MKQAVYKGIGSYKKIKEIINSENVHRVLLVCGKNSFDKLDIWEDLQFDSVKWIRFSNYTSNPKYEEVINGVELFRKYNCEMIVAIGGGSAIDVAKSIRYFVDMDLHTNCLEQEYIKKSDIKLIACPTTAGTGSESTHFATLYKDDEKYSVSHVEVLPDYVILDASFLTSVPEYHKKSAFMDALCHAIESWWSKRATSESIEYSQKAIKLLLENRIGYFGGNMEAAEKVLEAANYAGKAINITTTTAAHAMSYKLTSMFGISHGHAVALCLIEVLVYNLHNGVNFEGLYSIFKVNGEFNLVAKFMSIVKEMNFGKINIKESALEKLVKLINIERLSNNPFNITEGDLYRMYKEIICGNMVNIFVIDDNYKIIKGMEDRVLILMKWIRENNDETMRIDVYEKGKLLICMTNNISKYYKDGSRGRLICANKIYEECSDKIVNDYVIKNGYDAVVFINLNANWGKHKENYIDATLIHEIVHYYDFIYTWRKIEKNLKNNNKQIGMTCYHKVSEMKAKYYQALYIYQIGDSGYIDQQINNYMNRIETDNKKNNHWYLIAHLLGLWYLKVKFNYYNDDSRYEINNFTKHINELFNSLRVDIDAFLTAIFLNKDKFEENLEKYYCGEDRDNKLLDLYNCDKSITDFFRVIYGNELSNVLEEAIKSRIDLLYV